MVYFSTPSQSYVFLKWNTQYIYAYLQYFEISIVLFIHFHDNIYSPFSFSEYSYFSLRSHLYLLILNYSVFLNYFQQLYYFSGLVMKNMDVYNNSVI